MKNNSYILLHACSVTVQFWVSFDFNISYSCLLRFRPTQSIMYVPLQVNRFRKSVLLIIQYKYLKSCSGDFYCQESDPPHKIMRYWLYYSICWFFHFQLTESVSWNDLYWLCTSKKFLLVGAGHKLLHDSSMISQNSV